METPRIHKCVSASVAMQLYKCYDKNGDLDYDKFTDIYLRWSHPELYASKAVSCKIENLGEFDKGKRRYFITITDRDGDYGHVYDCLRKIVESKAIRPWNWLACWELTKEGRPHIHLLIDTDNYVKTRDLVKWNNGQIVNVQKVKNLQSTVDYIMKNDDVRIVNYLKENKLSQFMYKNAPEISEEVEV